MGWKRVKLYILLAGLFFLAAGTMSAAPPPIFKEVMALSPNRHYCVEVTAPPEKELKKRKRALNIFRMRIALIDARTHKTMWTRSEMVNAEDLNFPRRAFVSDTGIVVFKSPQDLLTFYSPRGKELGAVALLSWLPDRALKKYRRSYFTTEKRGMLTDQDMKRYADVDGFWEGGALFYFLDTPTSHLFVIKTWWGKRIFLDVLDCEQIATDDELDKAADEAEKNFITHVMEEGIRREEAGKQPDAREDFIAGLMACIFWSGKNGDGNAVPLLRKLERSDWHSGTGLLLDSAVNNRKSLRRAKKLNPFSYSTYKIKQVAQVALRELGEQPQPPGAIALIEFLGLDQTPESREYPLKPLDRPRESQVDQLRKLMTPEQVLNLMGYPDFAAPGTRTWEYDIDGDDPYTLTIRWNAQNRVYSLKIARPPFWQDNEDRDKMLALSLF